VAEKSLMNGENEARLPHLRHLTSIVKICHFET